MIYVAIGNTTNRKFEEIINDFYSKIDAFIKKKVPQYLTSTLRDNDKFNIEYAVHQVKDFITKLMILSDDEHKFIDEFDKGNYNPSLLFDDQNIIKRITNHSMALWKISNK